MCRTVQVFNVISEAFFLIHDHKQKMPVSKTMINVQITVCIAGGIACFVLYLVGGLLSGINGYDLDQLKVYDKGPVGCVLWPIHSSMDTCAQDPGEITASLCRSGGACKAYLFREGQIGEYVFYIVYDDAGLIKCHIQHNVHR